MFFLAVINYDELSLFTGKLVSKKHNAYKQTVSWKKNLTVKLPLLEKGMVYCKYASKKYDNELQCSWNLNMQLSKVTNFYFIPCPVHQFNQAITVVSPQRNCTVPRSGFISLHFLNTKIACNRTTDFRITYRLQESNVPCWCNCSSINRGPYTVTAFRICV